MIELERRGSIDVLTLAHGKANALDLELSDALADRMKECDASSCTAVVITARGSIFSAGVDLLRIVDEGAGYVSRFLPALSRAFEAVFVCSKPVVAAVNGHAIAGGCILACAADRRLMARGSGRIGIPELQVGVPFPPVPIEIMRQVLSPPYLATLVFGGETVDADRAVERGLIDMAVDPNALAAEAMAAAERLSALPAQAFAQTKRLVRAPAVARMQDYKRQFDADALAAWSSPATLDAIRGYISRTFKKPA